MPSLPTQRWWRWLFGAAGSVFLLFPAIGVAGEEIGHVGDVPWWRWVWLVAASIGVFATLLAAPLATVWAIDRQRRTSENVELVTV